MTVSKRKKFVLFDVCVAGIKETVTVEVLVESRALCTLV